VMVGPKLRKWASGAENTIDLFEALTSVRPDGQFRSEIGVATAGSTIAPIVVLFQPSPKKTRPPSTTVEHRLARPEPTEPNYTNQRGG